MGVREVEVVCVCVWLYTETATIVPASYAQWRSDALYSPFEDIRQNLFTHLKYAQLRNDHKQPS